MHFRDRILYIGDVSAADLASKFGTPLYVYDARVIDRQIARIRDAFAALPFRPFYAMKANGNLEILRFVRRHGFGADCVSPGEIHLGRHAGFEPEEIWFTCSNVSDDDLRAVGHARIVINVNSMSEIDRALALGLENPFSIRINPDVGAGHHHDVVTAGGGVKFGIDLAEVESARMVVEDAGRKVVGVHAHIGSGVDSVDPLLESARRLLEIAPSFPNLRFINFGGGIGTPYRPGEKEFPIQAYGEELTKLAERALRSRKLTAILEPGRYVVSQSGILLSRVTSKRISAGVTWIGCDTGFNHLARPSKYGSYHHILNATNGDDASLRETYDAKRRREEVVVAGNICESGDVFTRDAAGKTRLRAIDETKAGDLLAFCDAGAYGFSMASHYNARLLPAEVMVDGRGARLIRERQTYDDLLRGQP
jgi:diaminopimelate decarboxylase